MQSINEIIGQYVWDHGIEMPEAPRGQPLQLLPTRMSKAYVDLAEISHWDPLLPVPIEQTDEDDHEYAERQCAVALDKEKSKPFWRRAVESDPGLYGSSDDKEAFLAREEKDMKQRSQEWGQQAVSLRDTLGLQPTRVDADGACGLSALTVAAGGTATHEAKESLRKMILNAAPQKLKDALFQKLLFILEGEPKPDEDSGQHPAPVQSLLGGSAGEDDAREMPDGLALETSQVAAPLSSAVAATATLDSEGLLETDNTRAEAASLEVDAAPPVAVVSEPDGYFNLSPITMPDASQIARESAENRARARAENYPWKGGARAPPQTGADGESDQSTNLEQTRGRSRSRSRSRSRDDSSSQLTQSQLHAGTQALVNSAFGISFSGIKRRLPEDNQDPVKETIDKLQTIHSRDEFLESIWPKDLFRGMENDKRMYEYVQRELDKIHSDCRNHREISQDLTFTTSMVAPVPLNKAAKQIALKHGIHTETFLLAVASNITWLEHHWTRLGAEPPPEGINVIEKHVGQRAWQKGMKAPQSQEVSEPAAWATAWKERVTPRQSQVVPAATPRGRGQGRGRGRGRGGRKGAAAANIVDEPQPLEPIPAASWALQANLQRALDELLPTCELGNLTLRSLRAAAAKQLGMSPGALEEHKPMFKAMVTEWFAERVTPQELVEEGAASTELIEASQRPGCAAQVSPRETPDVPEQVQVREVSLVHSIAPAIAVLLHGSASTKKSFTCDLTTDFMTKSPHAPTSIADGDAFMVEASCKGIRVGILTNDRVSATTDEVVNTFPTPWGDHQQAKAHVNHLPRSKCNTWTQGERDDVATANGTIHLKGYAFQLKAFGQNEACEWVWRPSENGWQKRLSVAISPNKNSIDEDANADLSMGVVQGLHDWMFKGPFAEPQYLCYDTYALGLYRTVRRAVDDWIDAKAAAPDPVERFFLVKLGFAFTDLRRFSHFAMRSAQFLEAIVPAHRNLFDKTRKEVNLWECAAGLHWWLRQLSLHAGFYRFWASFKSATAGAMRPNADMANLLAAAAPPSCTNAHKLEGKDAIKNAIMTNAKLSCTTTTDTGAYRGWLLGKFRGKVSDLASAIRQAADELAEVGLLKEDKDSKKRGRRVQFYRKVSWDEMTDDAKSETNRLQIPRSIFE